MKCKIIFHKGKNEDIEIKSPQSIIDELRDKQKWLHDQPIENILNLLEKFGEKISENSQNNFVENSKYISEFLKKENLKRELNLALRGNYKILDGFEELPNGGNKIYHAQPRGLAVHWLAGNVDELGILSIIHALITKNVSIVKIPLNSTYLIKLLTILREINIPSISGKEILKTIGLIYLEKEDTKNQEMLSKAADVRIAWGGSQATSSISSLPKNFFTEDIIFGPKYSYVILDESSINDKKTTTKLALDISVFDQNACSSPHTVFVETKKQQIVDTFAKELANAMKKVEQIIPKAPISENKSMEIHEIRAEYEFKGDVYASDDTKWTVIVTDEEGFSQPCFSRVIFVKKIEDARNLSKMNNRKIQTVGISMEKEKRLKLIDELTVLGGDRFPELGTMSYFESPWDGMFVLDRFVRWISTYN